LLARLGNWPALQAASFAIAVSPGACVRCTRSTGSMWGLPRWTSQLCNRWKACLAWLPCKGQRTAGGHGAVLISTRRLHCRCPGVMSVMTLQDGTACWSPIQNWDAWTHWCPVRIMGLAPCCFLELPHGAACGTLPFGPPLTLWQRFDF
jgi:hypothetical protein